MESDSSSSKFQEIPEVKPTQPTKHLEKANMQGECDSHCENEGTVMENQSCSSKHSIMRDEFQGDPLTKVKILDVYSDVFTGIGKFPGEPYKFQLKENAKPQDMHHRRFQFIYRMLSMRKSGIWNN